MANVDVKEFRAALSRFATGVTVVTTIDSDMRPLGMTVNSFASVSLEPPLVVWSIRRTTPSFAAFSSAKRFAINVLRADQVHLSKCFSRPGDKFDSISWKEGRSGMPLIDGAVSKFECRQVASHDGGDHVVILGIVESFAYNDDPPLLFFAGQYCRIERPPVYG